jgi:hypothetical protein
MALRAFQKDVIWTVMCEVLVLGGNRHRSGIGGGVQTDQFVRAQLYGLTVARSLYVGG